MSNKQENNDLVSVDEARRSEPIVAAPDSLAIKELDHFHSMEMHNLHRGFLGAIVGSGPEKPGNTAIIVIVFCFVFISVAGFKLDLDKQFDQFYKLITTLLGPVGLALGYLFGSREK